MLKDAGVCFACGKGNETGLQLDIRKTPDGVELEHVVPERFCGWKGMVHGGIVATLLDELAAWACTSAGQNAVTAELAVRFRRPLATGQRIRGFGRVVERRGRLVIAESRLEDEFGNLIAEATGKMMTVEGKVNV